MLCSIAFYMGTQEIMISVIKAAIHAARATTISDLFFTDIIKAVMQPTHEEITLSVE